MTEAVGKVVLPDEVGQAVFTAGCGQLTPPETCHDTVEVLVLVVFVVRVDVVLVVVWAATDMARAKTKPNEGSFMVRALWSVHLKNKAR